MAQTAVKDLLQIFRSCVSAVLPHNLIRKSIKYNPSNQQLTIVDSHFNLKSKNVYVVGTGKAVQDMAKEVEHILNSNIKEGIVSIPEGSLKCNTTGNIQYFEGAKNNLPDENAVNTSKKIKKLASDLNDDDLLLVLVSGGGSALLTLPKQPVTLEEKTGLIKKLANSGADIKELNTVRKRLSEVKGGQLAIAAKPAKVVSLILSDIVGDSIDLIASGPTVENVDAPSKALSILHKYGLFDDLPEAIKKVLKDENYEQKFPVDNVKNYIIGSNKLSIAAGIDEAKNLNYHPIALSSSVAGNVKDVACEYAKLTKIFCEFLKGIQDKDTMNSALKSLNLPDLNANLVDVDSRDKDYCLILAGEITVEVRGTGKGGRNQQLALEFSHQIHKMREYFKGYDVYFLSAGTDGIDGPTDAAGAIGYLDLISDATEESLDFTKYLKSNDSYNFYKKFKNGSFHVVTGHTHTNVMDIHLIILKKSN